jgi:hypothetical protein
MDHFIAFVYSIFLIKIIFVSLSTVHVYLKATGKGDTDLDKNIVFIKGRAEFIFICMMAILLIILFNPRTSKSVTISGEPKLLLYLFGIVLLITADWKKFIHESRWFEKLQKIIGKN